MSLSTRKDLRSLIAGRVRTLRRELGHWLVTLGIGAVIGAAGIRPQRWGRSQHAGPALTRSCSPAWPALAGLCYAELASMIPVAGSACTYAYATLGELVA
jgi:APA family basic amino acid/polyamine antiporter